MKSKDINYDENDLKASSFDLITDNDMKLLHSKPKLFCNEHDEELHEKEILMILEKLSTMKIFENKLAIRSCYADVAHLNKAESYYLVDGLEGMEELIECFDIKNGCDFGFDEGTLVIAVYGQGYEYRGVDDLIKKILYVNPVITYCEARTITQEFYEDLHKITVSAEMKKLDKMISSLERQGIKSKDKDSRAR